MDGTDEDSVGGMVEEIGTESADRIDSLELDFDESLEFFDGFLINLDAFVVGGNSLAT